MASLMQPAKYQVFQITVTTDDPNITFKGEIERLASPGFLLVYDQAVDDEISLEGSSKNLKLSNIRTEEKISSPPSRYGEASIVKDLEKLEIGRPSTYAALITKIKDRKYIEEKDHDGKKYDQKIFKLVKQEKILDIIEENKEIILGKEKKRLTPTALGMNITKILIELFPNFMDIHFTAQTEQVLDDIALGKKKKLPVLTEYWNLLKNYLDNLSAMVITKIEPNMLGEYNDGKIYIVNTRYGNAIRYDIGKTKKYINIKDTNINLEEAITIISKNKTSNIVEEKGELIGEDSKHNKYYKTVAKFGPVIKKINNDDIEYRNIKGCKNEITLELALLLFTYPKKITKTISLNYNLLKNSYYLKEDKKCINFPKENLEYTDEDILTYWKSKVKE
jgi:DNA topoisomerase-1